ncbi:hypothetical protein HYW21_05985 [Candidatus Woesearchaeota archaeon]|nr:hypothetical protein [Candidatus Woesearchaeota archaeon]
MVEHKKAASASEISQEQQVGFHKGALSTLAKERQELLRILQIVEQLMQMHVKGLQDLGVDLAKESEKGQQSTPQSTKTKEKRPIEDLLPR